MSDDRSLDKMDISKPGDNLTNVPMPPKLQIASHAGGTSVTGPVSNHGSRPSSPHSPSPVPPPAAVFGTGEFAGPMAAAPALAGDPGFVPPTGVHPWIVQMLTAIRQESACTSNRVNHVEDRVGALEGQHGHIADAITQLTLSNKTILGRLQRAEITIERQRSEINDLRARSMRNNIIVKTRGDKYLTNFK